MILLEYATQNGNIRISKIILRAQYVNVNIRDHSDNRLLTEEESSCSLNKREIINMLKTNTGIN